MKIAGVQMDVKIGENEANLLTMERHLRRTVAQGAQLTVFPECALSGYCFNSLEEARPVAEQIPGPATERLHAICQDLGCFTIFGLLEASGALVFNSAVLIGPVGVIGSYRKTHLPYLGVDRFTTLGDRPFSVHQAGPIKVGMNICYDAGFPESARTLTLLGAELIVLPTNWPPGAEYIADNVINTRAFENTVYYIAVNRAGTERGFEFIGRSRIVDPRGTTLVVAQSKGEEVLFAEIDPLQPRQKHWVNIPGQHEVDRIADRRPEMYRPLVEPHSLPRPGGRA
ncbi:MAG: carbon-nitrogen hydrolase family protein [Deltaproteobacteria bacterium]|nr:carbon-nitrogen hydrolase family protein [Deltaproteobacteria bacterium]